MRIGRLNILANKFPWQRMPHGDGTERFGFGPNPSFLQAGRFPGGWAYQLGVSLAFKPLEVQLTLVFGYVHILWLPKPKTRNYEEHA